MTQVKRRSFDSGLLMSESSLQHECQSSRDSAVTLLIKWVDSLGDLL